MCGDIVDLPRLGPLCRKYGPGFTWTTPFVGGWAAVADCGPLQSDPGRRHHHGHLFQELRSWEGLWGGRGLINYIKHVARSFIFSASLPAPNVMAASAALDIMETEPEHVEHSGTTRTS